MSKPVKDLIRKELANRFRDLSSLAVVDFTRVDAVTTSQIRARLVEKDIRMMVVKNSLARRAFKEVGLDLAAELLDGPSAIAYTTGPDKGAVVAVVRELLEIAKDEPNLTVKAALLDGEVFGSERIQELSKFPTRDEALARMVQCVLSPGSRLGGTLGGPGAKLASLVKAIEQKQESGGEQAA
jgi:large subunit ribosomal protein L10